MRPRPDFFRTRKADANGIKIRNLARAIIRARTIQGLPPSPAEPGQKRFDNLVARARKTSSSSGLASTNPETRQARDALIRRFGLFQLRLLAFHQLDVQAERLQLP